MGVHSAKALRRTPRMTRPHSPKKSETLEIRLPHQTKTDFMARCQTEGRTASEAVRRFIEVELTEDAPRRMRPGFWPARWPALGQALAAAAAGLAIGAVAAPSLAQTSPGQTAHAQISSGADPRAAFDRLDRNHDGVVSYVEFRGR
jgi:hypothetical protein